MCRNLLLMVIAAGLFAGGCDFGGGGGDASTTPGEDTASPDVTGPADATPDVPTFEDVCPTDIGPEGAPTETSAEDVLLDIPAPEDTIPDLPPPEDTIPDVQPPEDTIPDVQPPEDSILDAPPDVEELGDIGDLCGPDGGDCKPELVCCYPCGIEGCQFQCMTPCDEDEIWCSGGCPMLP